MMRTTRDVQATDARVGSSKEQGTTQTIGRFYIKTILLFTGMNSLTIVVKDRDVSDASTFQRLVDTGTVSISGHLAQRSKRPCADSNFIGVGYKMTKNTTCTKRAPGERFGQANHAEVGSFKTTEIFLKIETA